MPASSSRWSGTGKTHLPVRDERTGLPRYNDPDPGDTGNDQKDTGQPCGMAGFARLQHAGNDRTGSACPGPHTRYRPAGLRRIWRGGKNCRPSGQRPRQTATTVSILRYSSARSPGHNHVRPPVYFYPTARPQPAPSPEYFSPISRTVSVRPAMMRSIHAMAAIFLSPDCRGYRPAWIMDMSGRRGMTVISRSILYHHGYTHERIR